MNEQYLADLSKEELIEHIKKKNEHINHLKNLLIKKDEQLSIGKAGRQFDFSKYSKKHVALKFFYLGNEFVYFEREQIKIKRINF